MTELKPILAEISYPADGIDSDHMAKRRKLLLWIFVSLAAVIGLVALYTKYEYTLVPELREQVAGSDAIEGVALGRLLFDTRGCGGCHTLGNLSVATIGPDLSTIAAMMTAIEIKASIVSPDAEISGNCMDGPCAAGLMPAFGDILDEREIEALVAFLLEYGNPEF